MKQEEGGGRRSKRERAEEIGKEKQREAWGREGKKEGVRKKGRERGREGNVQVSPTINK